MRDTFVSTLLELARNDDRILLATADLGFGAFDQFLTERPHQFLNVGVAEQNLIAIATGLALEGRVVFAYSIANFPTLRALEHLRNNCCYHGADVKVVSMGAGLSYGALGISHHATEDVSILRALPGLTILSPCDKDEVRLAVEEMTRRPGPAVLRLDKSSVQSHTGTQTIQFGKARLLRAGRDLTLFGHGGILDEALSAATTLATRGIECRVMSMHTLKPIDTDALHTAVRETGGIVTLEEHTLEGGLGSAVAERLLDAGTVPRFFLRLGLRDEFASAVGSQTYLRRAYALNADAIAERISTAFHAR